MTSLHAFKALICLAFTISTFAGYAQTLKSLRPELGRPNVYSANAQQRWENGIRMQERINAFKLRYEALTAADQRMIDSLEEGYGPMTEGPGCSWYCGGLMYKVSADSQLPGGAGRSYKAENAHDFNLLTAWVPDSTGGPVGKKIRFHFKPLSPRVHTIIVYNGYLKNTGLFKANARVKSFRLYLNGEPHADLELADTTASQSFRIAPVRSNDPEKDLILTLEITGIYPGSKYSDVAISEINFDGTDVH